MKAEELRIGNWVLGVNHEPYQVDCIISKNMFSASNESKFPEVYMYPDLKELPLTLEILEKAKFIKNIGYNIQTDNYRLSYYDDSKEWELCYIPNKGEWQYANLPVFKYLHILQNFYFGLTGIELKIEL